MIAVSTSRISLCDQIQVFPVLIYRTFGFLAPNSVRGRDRVSSRTEGHPSLDRRRLDWSLSKLMPNSKRREKKLPNLAFRISQKAQITSELQPIEIPKKHTYSRIFVISPFTGGARSHIPTHQCFLMYIIIAFILFK